MSHEPPADTDSTEPTQQLPEYQPAYSGWSYQPYQYPRAESRLPGWAWPLIAALALVVGLLGGALGGAVVGSFSGGGSSGGILTVEPRTTAPLKAENGSVAAVAAELLPSTVQIISEYGGDPRGATGSGFVLDRRGHIITNNHVVAEASGGGNIEVIDSEGVRRQATIVGRSPVYDLAVLHVKNGSGLSPASLGSSLQMQVGETVVAFGSPLGLTSSVTSGILSALHRPVTTGDAKSSSYIDALQTDAAINPGNSGGPLVNLRGQVIGVNSAIATTGVSFGGEAGNIGVGFAIPVEQVEVTADQILSTGEARYPVIGANVDVSRKSDGAEIVEVPSGTPAAGAGLRKGDVVTAVDDLAVSDGIELIVAIRSHQPGETITLQVRRDGRMQTVRVRLDSKVG